MWTAFSTNRCWFDFSRVSTCKTVCPSPWAFSPNQDNKDVHFRENVEYVKEQAQKKADSAREERKLEKAAESKDSENKDVEGETSDLPSSNNQISQDIQKSLDAEDPWMAAKRLAAQNKKPIIDEVSEKDSDEKVINNTAESESV